MNHFIELTTCSDNTKIWVNPDRLDAVQAIQPGATRLCWMTGPDAASWTVSEPVSEILGKLGG